MSPACRLNVQAFEPMGTKRHSGLIGGSRPPLECKKLKIRQAGYSRCRVFEWLSFCVRKNSAIHFEPFRQQGIDQFAEILIGSRLKQRYLDITMRVFMDIGGGRDEFAIPALAGRTPSFLCERGCKRGRGGGGYRFHCFRLRFRLAFVGAVEDAFKLAAHWESSPPTFW